MKKFLIGAFFLAATCNSLFAQKEIISHVTDLIVQKNISGANFYLDSVIKKNPKSVDALMMKGNLILNVAMDTTEPMKFISETDESIFTASVSAKPKLLSKETVYEVEKLWRKCLLLDSTRTDLRKGLCTIYSLALMKDSLQNEMLRLRKTTGDGDDEAFKMCEYARKFKERNRFDDAMDLYAFIAAMFPQVAGIRCDMASEYFYEGRMSEALLWLDSSYKFKSVDETSFLNGAFVFSQLGYFENAQSVLNAYSHIYNKRMDGFYYGLMLFADASPKSSEVLLDFCNTVDSNAYATEVSLSRELIAHDSSFTFEIYRALVTSPDLPDYYKVLIHTRAVKQFSKNCEPYFMYGIYQSLIKNYSAAVQFLEEGEQCRLKPEQTEYWKLNYAFALYKMNMREPSQEYFKQLFTSHKPFYEQAAKYFSVKILIVEKKPDEAKPLLQEIISSKEKTKYGELALQLL